MRKLRRTTEEPLSLNHIERLPVPEAPAYIPRNLELVRAIPSRTQFHVELGVTLSHR